MDLDLEGFSIDGTDKDVDYSKVMVFISENRLHQVGITANKVRKNLEAEGKLKTLDNEQKEQTEEPAKPNRLGNLFKLYSRTIALTRRKPEAKEGKEEEEGEKKEDGQPKTDEDHESTPEKQNASDKTEASPKISTTPEKSDESPEKDSPKADEEKLSTSEEGKTGEKKPAMKTIGNLFRFFTRPRTKKTGETPEESAEEQSKDKASDEASPSVDETKNLGDKSLETEPTSTSGDETSEKSQAEEQSTEKPEVSSRKPDKEEEAKADDEETTTSEKSSDEKPRKDSKVDASVEEKKEEKKPDEEARRKTETELQDKDSEKNIKMPENIDKLKDLDNKLNAIADFEDTSLAGKGSHVEEFIPDFDDEEPEKSSEEDPNQTVKKVEVVDDDENLNPPDAKLPNDQSSKSKEADKPQKSTEENDKSKNEKIEKKPSVAESLADDTVKNEPERKDSEKAYSNETKDQKGDAHETEEQKVNRDGIEQKEKAKKIEEGKDKDEDLGSGVQPPANKVVTKDEEISENSDSQTSKEIQESISDAKDTTNKVSPTDGSSGKVEEPTNKDKMSDISKAEPMENLDENLKAGENEKRGGSDEDHTSGKRVKDAVKGLPSSDGDTAKLESDTKDDSETSMAIDKKPEEDKTTMSKTDPLQKTENKIVSADVTVKKDGADVKSKKKSSDSKEKNQEVQRKEQPSKQVTVKPERKGSTVKISDKATTVGETKKPEKAKSNEKLKDSNNNKTKQKEPAKAISSGSVEKLKSTEKLSDQKNKISEIPSKKARSSDKLGVSNSSEKLQDQTSTLSSKRKSLPGKTENRETKPARQRSVSLKPDLQSRRSKSSDKLGVLRSSEKLQDQQSKASPGKADGTDLKTGRLRSMSLKPEIQATKKKQPWDKRNSLQSVGRKSLYGKPLKTNEPLLEEEDDDHPKKPVEEGPCKRFTKHRKKIIGLEDVDNVLVLKTQSSYTSEDADEPAKDRAQEGKASETTLTGKGSKTLSDPSLMESKKKNDPDKKLIRKQLSSDNKATEDGKEKNNTVKPTTGNKTESMLPEPQVKPGWKNGVDQNPTISGPAQGNDDSSTLRSTGKSTDLQHYRSEVPTGERVSDAESSMDDEEWFDSKSYVSSDWYDAKSQVSTSDQYQDFDFPAPVPRLPDYGRRQKPNVDLKYLYDDPIQTYEKQRQAYKDPRNAYLEQRYTNADPRQAYMDPRLAYLDNIDRNPYDTVNNSKIPVPTKGNGVVLRGNHIVDNKNGPGFQRYQKDDALATKRSRSISPNKSSGDKSPTRIPSDVSKRKRPPMKIIMNKPVSVTSKEYSNISFLKMDRDQAEALKAIKPAHLRPSNRAPPSRITAYLHSYNNDHYNNNYDNVYNSGGSDRPSRSDQQLPHLYLPQEATRPKHNSSSAENFRYPPRLELPPVDDAKRTGRSPARHSDTGFSPQLPPSSSSPSRYKSRLVVEDTRPFSRLSHDGLDGDRRDVILEQGFLCPQSICRSRCNCLSRSVDDLADFSNSSSILKLTFVPPNRKPMWRI